MVRPTGLTAREQMWRLHRAPERPDKNLVLEHAFRITTFARAVFTWAELHLVKGSVVKFKPSARPRIEQETREAPLPYLDFDVDFFLEARRVTIARLNEFGETIELSPREFALTLLFDGETTASEAESIVSGSLRGKSGTVVTERLVAQVAGAGLSFSLNSKRRAGEASQRSSPPRMRKKRD